MPFQSVLSLLHVAALSFAIGAFLVLLRQLGLRSLSEKARAALVVNIRVTSYAMLLGVFLVCLTAGALLAFGILTTSQLPPAGLLAIRTGALLTVTCFSVFLHVQAMPMLKQSEGRKIVDTASAAKIMACALAASLTILGWALWTLSGTHAEELQLVAASDILPAAAMTISFLWSLLTLFLLGERGYAEIKALVLDIKKRLTPPTPLERQRKAREQRLQRMKLPMAPRRRLVA